MLKAADLVTQLRQRLIIGQSARLLPVAQSISYQDNSTMYRNTTCICWKRCQRTIQQPSPGWIPAKQAERLAAADVSRPGTKRWSAPCHRIAIRYTGLLLKPALVDKNASR